MVETLLARVPSTIEEALDPDWLEIALGPVTGGRRVMSVERVETIKAMASKVRIAVRFADDPDEVGHYCLKAFLGDEYGMGGETTTREAKFYSDIAPHISMRTPPVASAVIDEDNHQAILVMEDMIHAGVHFCSALEPLTADQAAQSLEQLARLHAASHLVDEAPWLPKRIDDLAANPYFPVEMVQGLLDDPRGDPLTAKTRSAEVLYAGMRALAERHAGKLDYLGHGDCHAGNLYWTKDGPGFTDWQLVQRGHWSFDVAYHLNAILPVEVAETEERSLLDHYLGTLRNLGGAALDRYAAWEEYRAAIVYGFFHWAITRRVRPETITYEFTKRLGLAMERHETYALLGV